MDINTGKINFNSKNWGYKAVYNTLVPKDGKSILINGFKKRQLTLGKFDAESGQQLWEITLDKNRFLDALKRDVLGKEKVFLSADGNILWLNYGQFVKIGSDNGRMLHEAKNISDIAFNLQKNILFIFTETLKANQLSRETAVYATDASTLKPIWKDTLKITGNIIQTAIDSDKLIAITSKGFNVINTATGEKQWEKSEVLPLIKKIVPTKDGYLVAQEQFLTHIDGNGRKIWDQRVKISKSDDNGIIYLEEKNDLVLSITPSFIHKLEAKTGTAIWNGPQVLNSAIYLDRSLKISRNRYRVWTDSIRQAHIVYSNNSLFQVGVADTLKPKLLLTFESNQFPSLELRKNGYFISERNNFYFIDQTGKLRYEKIIAPSDKASFFGRTKDFGGHGLATYKAALLFLPNQVNNTFKSVLVSSDFGAISATTGFIYGNYQDYMGMYSDLTHVNKQEFGSYAENLVSRIEKGKKNDKSLILALVQKKQLQLIELDKESGREKDLKTITTDSNDFIIDQVEKSIYVFHKKKILAYALE